MKTRTNFKRKKELIHQGKEEIFKHLGAVITPFYSKYPFLKKNYQPSMKLQLFFHKIDLDL